MINLDKAEDWELHRMLTMVRFLKNTIVTSTFKLNLEEQERELIAELKERDFITPKGRELFPLAWDFGIYK